MSRPSRPFALWILLIVFSWSFVQGGSQLSNITQDPFYLFYEGFGAGRVQMLVVATITALDLVCAWLVVRPRPLGFRLVLVDLALSWGRIVARIACASLAPERMHDAFREAAAAQAVELGEGEMEWIEEPVRVFVAATLFIALLVVVTVRQRAYFLEPEAGEDPDA